MTDYTELQAELAAKKAAGWQCTGGLSIDTVLALIADLDEARNGMKHSCAIRLKKEIERLEAENKRLREDPGMRAIRSLRGDCTDLVAERDQLKAELAGLRTGYEAYESVNMGLKAEVETLVAAGQALRDEWRKDQADAERYRYLRDRCGLVEYKVIAGSIGPGMLPSGEKLDVAIDAAMGKGEQS